MNRLRRRASGDWGSAGLLLLAVLAAAGAGAALTSTPPDVEAGRLARVLHLERGSIVAEIGAGGGEMAVEMARVVGEGGRVYSTELGRDKVEAIREAAGRAGTRAVTAVEAAEKETGLPPACCDAIYMRRVYHHFTHPHEINASLFASLRPGGYLAVIDFDARGGARPAGVPADRGGHGIRPAIVVKELGRTGFEHVLTEEWNEGMYLVLFRKPASGVGVAPGRL